MPRGRSGFVYLNYAALALLSYPSVAVSAKNIWFVDIDLSPAPSPEDGPPFSAHATRNLALLPYQIVGIVGAYLATVLILGTMLLTVGRGMRTRAQRMDIKATEMVRPYTKTFGASPISPRSQKSWYSPRKYRSQKSLNGSVRSMGSNPDSPAVGSVVSFDDAVIQTDRQKRQDEMERLYAAVMAQDEARAHTTVSSTELAVPPPEYSRANPPRLQTALSASRPQAAVEVKSGQWEPQSPMTPKSPIRAIYPPHAPMPAMPMSPTSPIRAEPYPTTLTTPSGFPSHPPPSAETHYPHHSRRLSSTSSASQKKLRKAVRSLKISAPLHPPYGDDNSDGARTPLSPRFYADPGIPPEPPTTHTIDSQYPQTTPGTARSHGIPEEYDEDEDDDEVVDQIRGLPPSSPMHPASPPQSRIPAQRSIANVNNPLPFRAMQQAAYHNQRPALPNQYVPYSNGPLSPSATWNSGYPLSAGPVKTTFLETRARGARGHLNTATLQTPRTGMMTPYSPYMPFTPLTPVTPRLTTRAERRQIQREERRGMGVVTEEDAVRDEADLWSSGYD